MTSRAGRPAGDGAPTIRPARPDDAAAIAAIRNGVIRDASIAFRPDERRDAELRARIGDHAHRALVLVAEDEGAVAGFAGLGQRRPGPSHARTLKHTPILAPAARGQCLGRPLPTAVEARARSGGARTIWTAVSAESAPRRLPPRLSGVGPKFGRPIDLVLTVGRLRAPGARVPR